MSEPLALLNEAADELAWLHVAYMGKAPLSEGVPRIIRLLQKIEAYTGHATESPYPQAGTERLLKRETKLTERAEDWQYKYEQLRARMLRLEEALKEIEDKDSRTARGQWYFGPFAKIAQRVLGEK